MDTSILVKRDNNWVAVARQLQDTQNKIKFLKEKKDKIEFELRRLSENVSSTGGGYRYKLYKRPGIIDYMAIPELKGLNLERYRKEEQKYWKLSFTEQFNI